MVESNQTIIVVFAGFELMVESNQTIIVVFAGFELWLSLIRLL